MEAFLADERFVEAIEDLLDRDPVPVPQTHRVAAVVHAIDRALVALLDSERLVPAVEDHRIPGRVVRCHRGLGAGEAQGHQLLAPAGTAVYFSFGNQIIADGLVDPVAQRPRRRVDPGVLPFVACKAEPAVRGLLPGFSGLGFGDVLAQRPERLADLAG